MAFNIKKATKTQSRLRAAFHGPSGCGKTFTALRVATNMGKRVCLIDTEHGSASKYADKFDFDVLEVTDDYNPLRLIDMLSHIASEGYDVAVVDSMTHFWNGTGGFLELVDQEVKRMKASNKKPDSFAAWKAVDPVYKRMVHAIQTSPMHVIVTLRAKTEYAKVEGEGGRTKIQKLGLAPEMRDNFQYEMDVEGMLDLEHDLAIGKTRCDALDGRVFSKPGEDLAGILRAWLSSGAPPPPAPPSELERLTREFGSAKSEEELGTLREQASSAFKSGKLTKEQTEQLIVLNRKAIERIADAAATAAE